MKIFDNSTKFIHDYVHGIVTRVRDVICLKVLKPFQIPVQEIYEGKELGLVHHHEVQYVLFQNIMWVLFVRALGHT